MEQKGNNRRAQNQGPRLVAMLAFEGAQILDVTGPLEVFAVTNGILERAGEGPSYRVTILAERPGAFATSSGLGLVANASWRDYHDEIDTLFIAGGPDMSPVLTNPPLLGWLRNMSSRVRRLASVCTGAFALSEAGLLDGRRATTHWLAAERLAHEYPRVRVEPDAIFLRDGSLYTSAGVTSGMDLALALVEEDYGRKVALEVARRLVLYLKRPGGQSQFSTHLRAQGVKGGRLASVLEWIRSNFRQRFTVDELADRAAMSPRTFARIFVREIGISPARYVEQVRLEQAVRSLEETGLPVKAIAQESGFASAEQMCRAFQRHLKITPQAYRERFQTTAENRTGRRAKHHGT